MKKTLAVLSLAALTLGSGMAEAQSRRGDASRGGQCMEQIKRLRNELIAAQSENMRLSTELGTCRANNQSMRLREELRLCRDSQTQLSLENQRLMDRNAVVNSDLAQCQVDLQDARRNGGSHGNRGEVRRLRDENAQLITENNRLNDQIERQRNRIEDMRLRIQDLEDQLNGGGLPPMGMIYSAKCEVDDDSMFDFGQFSMGRLEGTLSQIQADCDNIARAQYGSMATSGLTDVKFLGDTRGLTSAVCHIDDDSMFDYDQFSQAQARIYGTSVNEVINECKALAKYTFGSMASSGIKDVRNN